jgi:hypothetical protein
VAPAVAVVDVLDDLLPAARLDVDVDVRRPSRAGERNRSKSRSSETASTRVTPST